MAAARLAPDQDKAGPKGAEVAFVDEVGHSFQARTGTTWAPEGETPILRRVSQKREVSTLFTLTGLTATFSPVTSWEVVMERK